jgi:RND family efflux transporter MFP subunit
MFYKFKKFTNGTMIIFITSLLLVSSCMKEEKEKTKSMEDLQKEAGIPVKVLKVKKETFDNSITFFAKLSGIKESSVGTNFSEYVKKVNANVGDHVKSGQVIIEFPTDNPQLQYTQAKVALENAEKLYKRMKELLDAGETAQANFDNAQLNLEVSKRNFEAMKQFVRVEAPFSGTIIKLDVKEGEVPPVSNPGMPRPLFTVAQLDVIKATIQANEQEINHIKMGMTAKIKYNAEEFTGRVAMISPALDQRTHAFSVEIHFPNAGRKLKSGVTTEVYLSTYSNPTALSVPRNLLITEGTKKYVFIEKNGIAEKRPILTGVENGVKIEVLEGLTEGDRLINCCKNQLQHGLKVNVVK